MEDSTHAQDTGRKDLSLEETEYEEIEASIDRFLEDFERKRREMQANQAEIDRLKTETRAIIAKLLAA
jgi:polyhydroxyalkanoate synthesis regulator phasin